MFPCNFFHHCVAPQWLAWILWPQKRGLSDQILNMPLVIERLYLLNVDLTIFIQSSTRFQLQDDVRRAHDSLEVSLVPFLRIFIIVGTNVLNQLCIKYHCSPEHHHHYHQGGAVRVQWILEATSFPHSPPSSSRQ